MNKLTKNNITKIFRMWLPLLACVFAASCGSEADVEQDEAVDANSVKVAFTMSVDEATATRAANTGWNDYDPTADDNSYENAIDLSSLQIFVCDGEGNPIDKVSGVAVHQQTSTTYAVSGVWRGPADKLSKAKKVMVLANCDALPISATASSLGSLSFVRASVAYIPMWGVASVGSLELGRSNDLGSVDLLRAMARIKVSLREGMADCGYELTSAKLNRHNLQGYALPLTFGTVASTKDVRFDGSLHVLESPTAEALEMASDGTATAYVPEYANIGTSATPATIAVTLSRKGKDESYTLRFVDYNANGAPTANAYNLQRNHSYEFVLYKDTDKLTVTLTVRKWNKREHSTVVM